MNEGVWLSSGTSRTARILYLASKGMTDREIAAELGIQPTTVGTYWNRVFATYDAVSRTEAVAKAMAEEAQSFRALVELSLDAIWVGRDNRILYANPASERLLGYPVDELIGRSPLEFLIHKDRPIAVERAERARNGHTNEPYTYTGVRADGQIVHFETVSGPIMWENAPAIMASARDHTKEFELMQAHERERKRLRAIIGAMPDMYFALSPEGVFLDHLVSASVRCAVDPDLMMGRHYSELPYPEINEPFHEAYCRLIETEEVQSFEYELNIPGEVHVTGEMQVALLEDGNILAIVRRT